MLKRSFANFCPVESSVNAHLDRQERAECADCGQECSADRGFCSQACEEHYEKREANLQRWNLRPKGKEIVVKGGPV